jgi:hypothetical protein
MPSLNTTNLSTTHVIVGFANIKTTRANICSLFADIKQKLAELNKIYMDVVKNHGIKEYTFGLDAFHFQSKLIEHEYENMQKLLNTITNRFYCEYYKLYKIIIDYVHNDLKLTVNIASKTVFPAYRDLDKHINYDFGLTVEIQAMSVKYINALNDYLLAKNKELHMNSTRQSKCGINIEHIVHYQTYTNALIAEQICMFIRYMDALNKHHTKYINRLYTICKHLLDDVNADIRTNDLETDYKDESANGNEVISMSEHMYSLPIARRATKFAPTTYEPTTFEPTTFEPTTFEPTTFEPTTYAPTTYAPTTFEPTTFAPTTFEPSTIYAKRHASIMSSPVLSRSASVISTFPEIPLAAEEPVVAIEEPVVASEEPVVVAINVNTVETVIV